MITNRSSRINHRDELQEDKTQVRLERHRGSRVMARLAMSGFGAPGLAGAGSSLG